MVKANDRPEKESYLLVSFFHGADAGDNERYTDWTQDTQGYVSVPTMKVEIPDNTATFDEKELRVIMPLDAFTERLSCGVPHSPTFIRVDEVTQGLNEGDQSSFKTYMRGRVVRTIKNFQGEAGKVAIFALPGKARLDVSMGDPCNHHCANTLFSDRCGLNRAGFLLNVTIDSVDGQEVTITGSGFPTAGADDRYWQRGYLERDGLRIGIRNYNRAVDGTKLYTARRVPNDWIGAVLGVAAVPGCDKSVEICRLRYNNEQGQGGSGGFLGLGYAIPAYHPYLKSE